MLRGCRWRGVWRSGDHFCNSRPIGTAALPESAELEKAVARGFYPFHDCTGTRPFHIDAWAVLPDHMHCVWTLPTGDDDFSNRWKAIKIRFVQKIPSTERRSMVRANKGERGIWQRRFWEHAIRDERDYANHIDYVHVNPLKHCYVTRVKDWPYSSFHRYVREGVLPVDWVGDCKFDADTDFGERP